MSDRNVCPKCGGPKKDASKMCWECRWLAWRGETVPTEDIDFIREAFEALVRACRGTIS